jgi:ATP-dependent DNA ligase
VSLNDAPYARNKNLRGQPLRVRRNVLEGVLDGQDVLLPVRRLADDGQQAWAEMLAHGWAVQRWHLGRVAGECAHER